MQEYPSVKKEAKLLKAKALNSLVLSVDHFNRQWDVGRTDTVLMLLQHAFEMLLKAAILERGGKIRNAGEHNTIKFEACIRRGLSDGRIKFLSEDQVLTLQTIDNLRDAAQHHLVDVSEGHLYLQAQSGVTLFGDILLDVFKEKLRSTLSERVLPVATIAPLDPIALFTDEVEQVRRLLAPNTRRRLEAIARLRGLAIVDGAIQGEKLQPSESHLKRLSRQIRRSEEMDQVFPGIASVNFVAEGSGLSFSLRLTKKQCVPVQLMPEGQTDTSVVAVKRVNELDFYNLGHNDLAKKVELTPNKTTAAIHCLDLKNDPDCFKTFTVGKTKFNRYSQKAIPKIEELVASRGIDSIWNQYRAR